MSGLIDALRAIIRDEMARVRAPELGIVTRVYGRAGDDAPDNHQVNVRLRATGVELQRVPVAVGRLGLSALPGDGELVLVAFAGGDVNAPLVMGSVYDETAHPPVGGPLEVVYQPAGDEDGGVRRVHVELPGGGALTLADDRLEVVLGGTTLVLKKDGDVVVTAKGKVSVDADGDVSLSAGGAMTLEAGQALTLKGMSVAVEGQSEAKVKGAQVALAGTTQFTPA